MKKLMLIVAGLLFFKSNTSSANIASYNIWVKNSTGKNLRVRIDSVPGCGEPNHGNEQDPNPLTAFHEDFWPTHSKCELPVTIYDPESKQSISVTAKYNHRSFEVSEVLNNGKLEFSVQLYGKN